LLRTGEWLQVEIYNYPPVIFKEVYCKVFDLKIMRKENINRSTPGMFKNTPFS